APARGPVGPHLGGGRSDRQSALRDRGADRAPPRSVDRRGDAFGGERPGRRHAPRDRGSGGDPPRGRGPPPGDPGVAADRGGGRGGRMMRRRRRALRAGAIALFALGGVAAASVLPVGHLLFSLRSAVHSLGAAGPPVTGLSFVVAACLFVPVTVLTIGCGYLLGPVWGVVVASLA